MTLKIRYIHLRIRHVDDRYSKSVMDTVVQPRSDLIIDKEGTIANASID